MKYKNLAVACFAATAILSAPAMASTMNFIENGSFEANQFNGSWQVFQGSDVPGWNVVSGAGAEIQTNTVGSVLDTPFGSQYIELDSHNGNGGQTTGPTNSSIAQSMSLNAGTYNLSFWYSPRTNNANDNGISYQLNGVFGPQTLARLRFTEVLSGNVNGPSALYPFGTWTEVNETFKVLADNTSFNLVFSATGNDNTYGGLLDNVSISAVPLPASSLLLLAGLGGLAAMRRRKTA